MNNANSRLPDHWQKSWCKEFSERQELEIDFRSEVPSALPFEVGLSLVGVLQEALNNVIKHSAVRWVEVQLREDSGEIHLVISDMSRGFDIEAALQGKGLGLTSTRERVRLLKWHDRDRSEAEWWNDHSSSGACGKTF